MVEAGTKLAETNSEIHALLDLIRSGLSSCDRRTANWADVGTAVEIHDRLVEVAKFMEGGRDEARQLASVRAKVAKLVEEGR